VFEVAKVTGFGAGAVQHETFLPFYADYDSDSSPHQAYFTIDREPRLLSEGQRRNGFRSSYVGSEVFVTLVDAEHAPYREDLRQLAVEILCTNRDLPLLMPLGGGETDFTLDAAAPVQSIRVIRGPSRPYSPVLRGGAEWRLVDLLSLNYLSLQDANEQDGAAALRDMLQLYAASGDPALTRQIEGVRSVSVKPVVRRLPGGGPITFGRGLQIGVEVDELAFQGGSAFVFGCVLEQLFARHVSINAFTETALRSKGRGEIHRWEPQWGTRPIL
jgi:type VI secretion system protein ImpG